MKRYEYKVEEYLLDDNLDKTINTLAADGWRIINFPEPHQGHEFRSGAVVVVHTVFIVFEREVEA